MVNWRNYFGYSLIFCVFLSMIDGRPNASSAGVARYGDERVRERDAGTEVGGEKEKLAAESVAASVTASGKRTANKKQGKKKKNVFGEKRKTRSKPRQRPDPTPVRRRLTLKRRKQVKTQWGDCGK